MHVTYVTLRNQTFMTSLLTSLVSHFDAEYFFLSVSTNDFRLIQAFGHNHSFVFFYISVILLEARLTG